MFLSFLKIKPVLKESNTVNGNPQLYKHRGERANKKG